MDSFSDSKHRICLDEFGFPQMAVANRILIGKRDFGEKQEALGKSWQKWLHHIPFDAPVAEALGRMYEERTEKLDEKEDAAVLHRLAKKLRLTQDRAMRYGMGAF
jgi:hypothetical protein